MTRARVWPIVACVDNQSPPNGRKRRGEITPSQHATLVAIRDYLRANKVSPTYLEIAEMIGSSKETVRDSIVLLIAKGLVVRKPGRYRNLGLTYRGFVLANREAR